MENRGGRLLRRLHERSVEHLVAPGIRCQGIEVERRARLVGFVAIISLLASLLWMALQLPGASIWTLSGAAIAAGGSFATLALLRMRDSLAPAVQVQCASGFAVMAGVALLSAGAAPAVAYFGVLPGVYAMLALSLRSGLFWSALWIGLLIGAGSLSLVEGSPIEFSAESGLGDQLPAAIAFQLILIGAMYLSEKTRTDRDQQVRASERRYASLVQKSPLGICSVDSSGVVLDLNSAMRRLLGAPESEPLVGANIVESKGFEALANSPALFERLLRGEHVTTEHSWTTIWGKRVLLRLNIALLPSPEGGRSGIQFICEDVTEQRAAEHALRLSEARHRQVLSHITDAIAEVDGQGLALFVSSNSEQVFGCSPETLGSLESLTLIHPADRDRAHTVLARGVRGEAQTLEAFRFQKPAGQWVWLESQLKPFQTESGEQHTIITTRDVSARVELERHLRQSHKMEAVGLLAGGIAHDFNNLLTVVLAAGENLLDSSDPRARKLAHEVVTAAERGAALTRRLLTFSRSADYQRRLVDLNDLARGLAVMLERLIPETIELSLDLSADLPKALVDPSMIEEALVNLTVNAVDAMPDGGRLVLSTFEELRPSGEPGRPPLHELCVRVEDSGVGMTPEVASRAFEPFFSTKSPSEGTGLGLAVVYGIADQLGGSAEIDSRAGQGTGVLLRFPASIEDTGEVRAPKLRKQASFGNETILVAEDQPMVRKVTATALEACGYRVLVAADGNEALKLARDYGDEIDLILTDVVMPGLSGPELVSRLWSEGPGPRALLMSGYPNPRIGENHPFDAEQLLRKPFSSRQLAARVRASLDAPAKPLTRTGNARRRQSMASPTA